MSNNKLTILLETVREYSRRYSRGEDCKAEMTEAQRAYDIARTQPERDAAASARRAAQLLQNAIWESINNADKAAIHQMAVDADCIRETTVKGGPFHFYDVPCKLYVPPTSHWGHWRDDDAVRHHGVASVEELCDRFAMLANEPWDGTYAHLWSFSQD